MTPSARIAGLIELLDRVLSSEKIPMDVTAGDWFRPKRYIGSKDRSEIAERLYRIMRHKARYSWYANQIAMDGIDNKARSLVLIDCAFNDEDYENRLFSGGGQYAADPLSKAEKEALEKLLKIEPKDVPLDVRLEVPDWAAPMLKERYGADYEKAMMAMLETADLNLRVNTLKSTVAEAKDSLAKDGVETGHTKYSPIGLALKGKAYLAKTKAFNKGHVEIQDEGSQLIAALCDAKPSMRVLDYCAGGGGKTLALASAMENKGSIVASDNDARRLERGRKRYRKAGVHNVELKCIEDEKVKKWFKRQKETFDVVLVDAPCSSSGTWRRNPDLRWRFYGPSLDEIKSLQTQIMDRVAKCVKPGGRLVYATCSVFKEENENQIEQFLKDNPDFALMPMKEAWPYDAKRLPQNCDDYMFLSPHSHGTDGFFCAALVKKLEK